MEHVSSMKSAFHKTYNDLWPQVYRYIYYRVQNSEEAEELTQDVFQKVYKQMQSVNIHEEKIKSYIFSAAKHTIYDCWRRKGRSPSIVKLEEYTEKVNDFGEASMLEENILIHEAFKKLNKEDRQVLSLRIIEGYPIKDVAKILNKPEGTIKSLQFRAIQKLKKELEKGGYFDV